METLSSFIAIPLRIVATVLSLPILIIGTLYDTFFKKLPDEPHHILITGASSGICREVAIQYAKPGVTLFLIARNMDRLNATAEIIRSKGATVFVASIDATNKEKMKQYIQEQDRKYKLDLVIAGVGLVTPADACSRKYSDLYDFILTTNIDSCKNAVLPVIDSFRERRHGQICILSSVAGLGMNFISPLYSSTKIANYAFGEALRCVLSPYGVFVNVVCPGYTDTPILDTNSGRDASYILKVEDVAATIIDGLKHDYSVIECNMVYNLGVSFMVRDMPKKARDYLYQLIIPFAKRRGMYANEYPCLEDIYKKKSE